ncbi:hypothetical protein ACJVC5_14290 [Peredibacter sp. HCB2-198]|uniref:hypothetical protein n=1 Tax=Peredibacter sp. HCB2-198 TaxID=3383025 RepID=UPI0038B6939C
MNLKHLTDNTLLSDTKRLARLERETMTKILHHLKEIERRKLFCDLGYPNMLEYAVKELGYSEPSASRRINAAKLLKEIPEIEEKIQSGVLNLTNLGQAAGLFKKEKINEPTKKKIILKKLENKTKRQAEKILAELSPMPFPKEGIKVISPTYQQLKINISDETLEELETAKNLLGHSTFDDSFMRKLSRYAQESIRYRKFKIRIGNQVQP